MGLRGSKNFTTSQKVSAGKPGKSAGEVGTGGPGDFARGVTQDRDMAMSGTAKSGASPKMSSKTSEH